MAQFLIITENSLSLQSSPILYINHQRISKKNYFLLLRTFCKYLFYRRLTFQKKFEITSDFIQAIQLECAMYSNLSVFYDFPFKKLSYAVYHDILAHVYFHEVSENRPILFNLDTYVFSFFDERYNLIDDVSDLSY